MTSWAGLVPVGGLGKLCVSSRPLAEICVCVRVCSLRLIVLLRHTTQRDSTDTGELNFANMRRNRIPAVLFGNFCVVSHGDRVCVCVVPGI